ncbi:TPA: 3-hydroxyisobutyrate dehydrogenase, partial [Streptococcus pneumoniae]
LIYNSWGAYLLYSIKLFNPLQYDFSPKSLEVANTIVCNDGWMSLVCNSKLEQINDQDFDDIHFRVEYMVKDLEYANFSVFHDEVKEINYLLQQYRDCLVTDSGKDYTVIGKYDNL